MSNDDSGFSLIEALIALAIIAAMTGALVETITADAHVQLAVEQRRAALLIARSALDQAEGGDAIDAGHADGAGQPLLWRIDRQPYAERAVPFAATGLEQLTVTVADMSGRRLARLATVRIVQ
jgi:general secretion pathway protein I